jgi:protein-S-isoprenylcysteine O-methyltransferase Ste14
MEFFPELVVGWLNGWILLAVEILVEGITMLIFPKEVQSRLLDRSGWSKKQRIFLLLGKVFSLITLILIILTPLKTNTILFPIGLALYGIGLVGLVVSMINFKKTPLDQPVTRGLYRISRHPQIVSLFIIFFGMGLAVGSWAVLIALFLSRLLQHFSILAEEEVCLEAYGDSYRALLEKVPRYFLFF